MPSCDILLTHAHLLTLAPVSGSGQDDVEQEGVGYVSDGAVAIADGRCAPLAWSMHAGACRWARCELLRASARETQVSLRPAD